MLKQTQRLSFIDHAAFTEACEQGQLRAIDWRFARFMAEQASAHHELVFYSTLLLSQRQGDGHVCIRFEHYQHSQLVAFEGHTGYQFPDTNSWAVMLQASGVAGEPRTADKRAECALPLVVEFGRLYLGRYWFYETQVANSLVERATLQHRVDDKRLHGLLGQLFEAGEQPNWQQLACASACRSGLSVITGGPGTGKTTTVIRLLASLLALHDKPESLVIRMAAPTGKAAVRMSESIRNAKSSLTLDAGLVELIPEQASTLHRLLGPIPGSIHFRHDQDAPVHADVLVVDEASMIDLSMMTKLLAALPRHCRLILLGDKDQLSSVEAGSILGDVCSVIRPIANGALMSYSADQAGFLSAATGADLKQHIRAVSPVADSLTMLQKSWRFGGGIGSLASAVNAGDSRQALSLLQDRELDDINWTQKQLLKHTVELAVSHYQDYLAMLDGEPLAVLNSFEQFRVLCASRKGELGTLEVNLAIEKRLAARELISRQQEFYPGRPVMITRNDHQLKLYNGDIGITLHDSSSGQLYVHFAGVDGSTRRILPARLPSHDTAFAMTIHKSQGSEFSTVAICLPEEPGFSSLLVKELLYTAITRAKKALTLYANRRSLLNCCESYTQRDSGLALRLHGPD
ncbi:exodeoxyribonuclease V subunit alpha [Aliagarivorans marinus]|uniref:exodeoxyribonuclease V subunit alpha n=1 Tax=Aliagarivorans marinus TaxID=561965 RepID=UPI00041FAA69|nr:exodeoxyribonuclease V subunit alpha [Aliagarivorans marinus]